MTAALDFAPFVSALLELLDEHRVEGGGFSRWSARSRPHEQPTSNAYGVSNAVVMLHTLDRMPAADAERAELIAQLRSFQDPATGAFADATHSPVHTTAHLVAALQLLDARPAHPLRFLDDRRAPEAVAPYLDGLDWGDPWGSSHAGVGGPAALVLTEQPRPGWLDAYFGWLERNADPATGFWLRDRMLPIEAEPGRFANLGGAFHYHFMFVHFGRPLPHAAAVVDSCLELLERSPVAIGDGERVGFAEIDWAYSLHRAALQSGHRMGEVREALALVARRLAEVLLDPAYQRTAAFDDLHAVGGALSAVAELQRALPELVRTPTPLRLVLDRRPFV